MDRIYVFVRVKCLQYKLKQSFFECVIRDNKHFMCLRYKLKQSFFECVIRDDKHFIFHPKRLYEIRIYIYIYIIRRLGL
jgi:hypothetical protein